MPPTSEFGDQFTRSGGSDPEKGVTNGENDWFRANIQKTIEIEQVFVLPCRCWKSYLPYSKRSENIINQQIRKFYIEAIPKKNLNSEKQIFFRVQKKSKIFSTKKISKIVGQNLKKIQHLKFQKFGVYSFDVKFSDLSIYDVFRAFGVR